MFLICSSAYSTGSWVIFIVNDINSCDALMFPELKFEMKNSTASFFFTE